MIALTKRALGESGVNVDALESAAAASGKAAGQTRVERSGTVLLVKNLPYTASGPELQVSFLRPGLNHIGNNHPPGLSTESQG